MGNSADKKYFAKLHNERREADKVYQAAQLIKREADRKNRLANPQNYGRTGRGMGRRKVGLSLPLVMLAIAAATS